MPLNQIYNLIMKKFFTLAALALISGGAFTSMAEVIPGLTMLDPAGKYVSRVSTIRLAWDYNTETKMGAPLSNLSKVIPLNLIYNGEEYPFVVSVNKNPTIDTSNNTLVISMSNIPGLTPGQGSYSLTIPSQYVMVDGVPNEQGTVEFEVVGSIKGSPTVSPAAGEVNIAQVDGVAVKIDYGTDYSDLTPNTEAGDITVTYTNSGETPETVTVDNYSIDGTVLYVPLKTGIANSSTITVSVPSNFIIAKDADGNTCVGGGVTVTYNVWNGLPEATMLQEMPIDANKLIPVKAMWDNYASLELVGDNLPLELYFWDSANGKSGDDPDVRMTVYPQVSFENGPEGQENGILVVNLLNVVNQVSAEGYVPVAYYFNLPEGVIKSGDRINPYMMNFIKFQLPTTINNTPNTIYNEDDQTLILWFNDGSVITGKNGNVNEDAYLVSTSTGEQIVVNNFQEFASVEYGYYQQIDLSEYEIADINDYKLFVPWGYFRMTYLVDDIATPGVNCEWNLAIETAEGTTGGTSTGVNAISIADGEAVYYNLMGQKIINPVKGQIMIEIKDGKAKKVIF